MQEKVTKSGRGFSGRCRRRIVRCCLKCIISGRKKPEVFIISCSFWQKSVCTAPLCETADHPPIRQQRNRSCGKPNGMLQLRMVCGICQSSRRPFSPLCWRLTLREVVFSNSLSLSRKRTIRRAGGTVRLISSTFLRNSFSAWALYSGKG